LTRSLFPYTLLNALLSTAGQYHCNLFTTWAFPASYHSLYKFNMALLSAEHLAGPGYIILNVLRALNIIALASVVASSVVMLVKTFIISKVCQTIGFGYA
jgi:hypothetical protein